MRNIITLLLRKQTHRYDGIKLILAMLALSMVGAAWADDTTTLEEIARKNADPVEAATLPDAIEIEGDKLDMYLDRKMRASGNAVIRKGDQSVYGDKIEYDIQNDELSVDGNAKLELGGTSLEGPALKMRLSDSIGEMQDASMKLGTIDKTLSPIKGQSILLDGEYGEKGDPKRYLSDNAALNNDIDIKKPIEDARGNAEVILFNGPNKKQLKNARFTTCSADVDDWYIKAGKLDIDDASKRAVAKHARVEFKGVPILYSPWLSFSYNNQRESGLLSPSIGVTSRGGAEILVPYYWNISPDKDATLGARYMSKRGLQLQGEFRYLNEAYSGISSLEYLNNDSISKNSRYFVNLIHRHNFGQGWSGGFNIQRVSDDQYFSELSSNITSTSRVNLSQEAFVDYHNQTWHFNGLVQQYQTLDNLSYAYSRLPQLTLTAYKEFGQFNADFSSQYTYFDRKSEAPVAATGSRFLSNASISMPMGNAFGFFTPKLGVSFASYHLKNNTYDTNNNYDINGPVSNNTQDRILPTFSLDGGLYLDSQQSYFGSEYTQTLEPRMFYVYTPERDQSLLPVFDTGLADLNLTTLFTENQFTGGDRINSANQLSLALTTRLVDSKGFERISATIGQRIYLESQTVSLPGTTVASRKTSDFIAGFNANLSSKLKLDAFAQYNPDNNRLERSNLLARYNPEPGKLFNVGYRLTKGLLEQIDTSGQWPLGNGWYSVGRLNYSLKDKRLVESVFGLEYDRGCWQARTVLQRLETATSRPNYSLFFQLELGGLASIGSNPLNLLRRDIPGYLSSSQIPDFYRQQNYAQ